MRLKMDKDLDLIEDDFQEDISDDFSEDLDFLDED